jgi:hypothetical protein
MEIEQVKDDVPEPEVVPEVAVPEVTVEAKVEAEPLDDIFANMLG